MEDLDTLYRQIECDDPNLEALEIGYCDGEFLPENGDWERLGDNIGKSTHLKRLSVRILGLVAVEDFKRFARGLSANRSLRELKLNVPRTLAKEMLSILKPFFKNNKVLRELCLDGLAHISARVVWKQMFTALQFQSCKLEKLSLAWTNAAAIESLLDALEKFTSLKALNLGENGNVPVAMWHRLFDYLQSPSCQLEEINLENCILRNESMVYLSNSLTRNTSVKKLRLRGNQGITRTGWQAFSAVLQNPISALESLDLKYTRIGNEEMHVLTIGIFNNTSLKELGISWNRRVTDVGWAAFAAVLGSPNSALEKVDLSDNPLADDTLSSFATAVAGNSVLKELLLQAAGGVNSFNAFLPVLCNGPSIMDTYRSNHTLQKICNEEGLPADLRELLRINNENSESNAARLKIIKTHLGEATVPHIL